VRKAASEVFQSVNGPNGLNSERVEALLLLLLLLLPTPPPLMMMMMVILRQHSEAHDHVAIVRPGRPRARGPTG
jgi:hypothetical protein